MIDYFPTPYEDEWWYSILCRYYQTTGIKSSTVVKEMLFESENTHMGTLFPNGSIAKVVKQLPEHLYDIRNILLNHTTLKYFIRMYPKDEQEYIIKYLSEGGSYQITHLWRHYKRQDWKPRYCSECIKEDPEPYYHLSHQIPMVSVCTKHGCKLKMIPLEHAERELNTKFYPLALMEIDERTESAADTEMLIARLCIEHLKLPLKSLPGYNNLITGLINKGYWRTSNTHGVIIDDERVYADLIKIYEAAAVERYFGSKIDKGVMARIRQYRTLLPERYVLLQGLIEMNTEMMFGNEVKNALKDEIRKMNRKRRFCSIKQVAAELDLRESEVRSVCKAYGIDYFWMERGSGKSKIAKTGRIQITVDERELAEMRREAERLGFRCVGDYVMNCVRYVKERTSSG